MALFNWRTSHLASALGNTITSIPWGKSKDSQNMQPWEPTSDGTTASLKRGICLTPGVCRTGGTGLSEKSSVFAKPRCDDWKQQSLSTAGPWTLTVMSGVHGRQNTSAHKINIKSILSQFLCFCCCFFLMKSYCCLNLLPMNKNYHTCRWAKCCSPKTKYFSVVC